MRGARTIGLLAAGLVAAGASSLAMLAKPRLLPPTGAVPGLRVGGVELAVGEDIQAHVAQRARGFSAVSVRLRLPGTGRVVQTRWGKLGVRVEAEQVVATAASIGRDGPPAERLHELRQARRGEIDVPLRFRVDPRRVQQLVLPLKDELDRPARPARLDLSTGRVVPHQPGRYLDLDRTISALYEAAWTGQRTVEVPATRLAPNVSTQLVESVDTGQVISEYDTRFGGDRDRATNIATAAKRLDGVVLAPGELVSFNQVVGARTVENGFRPGWEIYKGEMVRGVGGGTCQVASTLHAAAYQAGLDIVERFPHSRPSAYIPLGLDSTVSWPELDLKLRNPWAVPMVIHTIVDPGRIRVQLLGGKKPAEVKYRHETLAVIPFKRKVTESQGLEEGTLIKKQKGIRGYRLRRTRSIVPVGGPERVETSIDHYPPTPEHYLVPVGTDVEAELPPQDGGV